MTHAGSHPIMTADILERVLRYANNHTLATCLRVNSLLFELAGFQLYHDLDLNATGYLRDFHGRSISPLEGYRAVEYKRSHAGKPRKRNTKLRLLKYVQTIQTHYRHEHTVGRLNPPLAQILPNCKTLAIYDCPSCPLNVLCSKIDCRVFRNLSLDTLVLDARFICCPLPPSVLGGFSRLVCISRLRDTCYQGLLLRRQAEQEALKFTRSPASLPPSVRQIDLVMEFPARDDCVPPLSQQGLHRYILGVASIRSDISVVVVNSGAGILFDDTGNAVQDIVCLDNVSFVSMREYLRDPGTRRLFSETDIDAWLGRLMK